MRVMILRRVFRKNLMSVTIPPAVLGRNWLCQFYWHLGFIVFFGWKTSMPINSSFGGREISWRRGWGECQFFPYGHGVFSDLCYCRFLLVLVLTSFRARAHNFQGNYFFCLCGDLPNTQPLQIAFPLLEK